jgi:hypothetical protein
MARLSDEVKAKKLQKAKELYITGKFSMAFIADTVDIKVETLKDWADKGNWDSLKTNTLMSVRQIQQMILKCAEDIQLGVKPIATPDQLSKLVAAFEKITDKDKYVASLYDAFTILFDHIMMKAQDEKNMKKRELIIKIAQDITGFTEEVITKALKDND